MATKDTFDNMTDFKPSDGKRGADGGDNAGRRAAGKSPDWANGLRRLYDSVVEEPLPDQFRDLLSQLDKND